MSVSRESGAALLTTLLLVASLAAISVAVMADMRRSGRIAANAANVAQAQWYALGAEAYVQTTAADLASGALPRTSLAGPARTFTFPLDNGIMHIAVRDGSTCINVNSVVAGAGDVFQRDESGARQLSALMIRLDIAPSHAAGLVDSLAAWIDSDGGAVGADDAPYAQLAPPYITGREPLAELSELRAIRGFSPQVIEKLKPWVCALPNAGPSRININALTPEQAILIEALSEGRIPTNLAADLVRRRPPQGWQSIGEAFADPRLAGIELSDTFLASVSLETRYLAVEVLVTRGNAEVAMSGLMVRGNDGFVTTARRWSEES